MVEYSGNLFEGDNLATALTQRKNVDAPTIERVDIRRLGEIATDIFKKPVVAPKEPLMELSARYPFDATYGRIDSYHPGRWDTESNLVFMHPIVQIGPSVGEWDGTVIYAVFNAPAAADYMVVGNFSGYDTTMHLFGPWGEHTAYTAQTTDNGAVVALWNGGGGLYFTMNCKGSGLGYLESIQVFAL
jgi:hypothetical protein